jgi:fructose-specific phosphotransferase system IIC component
VIGAVLQNQLATALHNQAVAHSSAVPASFRDQFIAAFSNVSSKGFEIGAGETGARLPSNVPAAVVQQLTAIAHDVFVTAYIDAMKSTFIVPVTFLVFTALTTLLIRRRARPSAAQQPQEEIRAAAG